MRTKFIKCCNMLLLFAVVISFFLVISNKSNICSSLLEESENSYTLLSDLKDQAKKSDSRQLKKGPEVQREFFKHLHEPYEPELNPQILNQMWADVKQMPSEEEFSATKEVKPWICLGPYGMKVKNEMTFWAGRVKEIEPPTSTKSLRVGAASGGLWEYFYLLPVPLSDEITSQVVTTFATDPLNDDHIILGTGEWKLRSGTGMFETFDGGISWSNVTTIFPVPPYFYHIRYAPSNPSIIYAATAYGCFRSDNNGQTWNWIFSGHCTDIAINSNDPNIIFTASWGDAVYKSINGGAAWEKISNAGLPTSNVGRTSISLCKSSPEIIYVCITRNDNNNTLGVYKSADNGLSWIDISPPDEFHWGQGWYNHTLGVSPVDPDFVFVGGVRLYRTYDAGQIWFKLKDIENIHSDHHAIAFSDDGQTIYNGNDGGISLSTDMGITWNTILNSLPISQFYHFDVHETDGKVITGGLQDNCVTSTINGTNWYTVISPNGGDGTGVCLDPANIYRQWAVSGIGAAPWLSSRFRTYDAWNSFSVVHNGIDPPTGWRGYIKNDKVPPVFLYTNADASFIYFSVDGGDNWTKLNTFCFANWICNLNVTKWVPGGAVVYASTVVPVNDSGLMVYDNGVWYARYSNSFPGTYINKVSTHPVDVNTAYAVMGTLDPSTYGKKIFKTTNRGVNWTNITGDLPNIPTLDVVAHPQDPDKMYLASEFGCFRTLDGGYHWHRWNLGMPEANIVVEMDYVDSLAINGKFYIVAATHGRGVWMREIESNDPHEWTGVVDNNWHNPANWTNLYVPGSNDDVVIKNTLNKCHVYTANASCKNIVIQGGSGNYLKLTNGYDLHAFGNFTAYGQLKIDHGGSFLIVDEDISWEAGSSADITANTQIGLSGDWYFQAGANVQLDDGRVTFWGGSTQSAIKCHDLVCYFNDLIVWKNWVEIDQQSTTDMAIHGKLDIQPNSELYVSSAHALILKGDLLNSGDYYCNDGSFVFQGDSQEVFKNIAYPTYGYFNDLIIASTTSTTIKVEGIKVYGDLTIQNGQLISNSLDIEVGGDWNNTVGPGGFIEGIGKVIFNGGDYIQYCSSEDFHILELNKTSGNDFLIDGGQVVCNEYDWNAGNIVVLSGSFTAHDLTDNGIFGGYYLNQGGEINLTKVDGWVDLNGHIYINGGTMNIYGGTTASYWPFLDDASITITDGLLEFHDQGIFTYDNPTYTLTESITGGTIRVNGGFRGDNSNFTPDGGTMEFVGNLDYSINTVHGNLHNVLINKSSTKNNFPKEKSQPIYDKRSGKLISNGSKSNTLNMNDYIYMRGDLVIDSGILNTNGHNLFIEGNWINNIGDGGFIESTGTVRFSGANSADIITDETFFDLEIVKTYQPFDGVEIASSQVIKTLNDLFIYDGTLEMNSPSTLDIRGDVFIAQDAGLNAGGDDTNLTILVGSIWTNENSLYNDEWGFTPGTSKVIFHTDSLSTLTSDALHEEFYNLVIEKNYYPFRPNTNIKVLNDLNVHTGLWWDNNLNLEHVLEGNFKIDSSSTYRSEGLTIFYGGKTQEYYCSGFGEFNAVLVNKQSANLYLNDNMELQDYLSVIDGDIYTDGDDLDVAGEVSITNNGALILLGGSDLAVGTQLIIDAGGVFIAHGSPGNLSLIHNKLGGYYSFEVKNGGWIGASYTHFKDMDANGIKVYNGGQVIPSIPFHNCVIDMGQNVNYAIRLRLYNNQVLTCKNVDFPNNQGNPNVFNVGKSLTDFGHVNFVNATGDFSGPGFEADPFGYIDWTQESIELNLRAMLEGTFNGLEMNTNLNAEGFLPSSQPFNLAPWNYNGSESVTSFPEDAVDWVLVELRDAYFPILATPITRIAQQAGFLLKDGSIKGMDGLSNLHFNNAVIHDLFVVIWHRNHLGIMSSVPVIDSGGIYFYDYAFNESSVFGDGLGHKLLNSIDSIYSVIVPVISGHIYYYKYINGNDWSGVELVPAECGLPDGFGGNNRVNTAPETDMVVDVACFSSCNPCVTSPAIVDVTFQVDMTGQTVSPDGVHIAGSFQGWDPATTEMLPQGNGIYAVTVPLNSGEHYRYKFFNGNAWGFEETVPNSCGLTDGSNDRIVLIPNNDITLTAVCFGSCNSCGTSQFPVFITFRVDMLEQIVSLDGIHVSGNFQGWDPAATEMTRDVWGMIAGDGDANGEVNLNDKTNVWVLQAGQEGYKYGDFNLDGQVNNPDKNDILIENIGTSSQVPD